MIPARTLRGDQFYPKADSEASQASLSAARRSEPVPVHEASALLEARGIVHADLQLLASGTFSRLWAFRDDEARRRVLKVDVSALGIMAPRVEHAVSRLLVSAGVRHPIVHASADTVAGTPWLVLDQVDGVDLRSRDADEDLVVEANASVAAQLSLVHAIDVHGFGLLDVDRAGILRGTHATWASYLLTRRDEHLAALLDAGIVSDATARSIRTVTDQLGDVALPTARLLHGDIGPHNVMLDGGDPRRILLIDWEDALAGDPLFELAQWATFQPPRRWEPFRRAYENEGWGGDLFRLYFLRITLAKAVVRVRLGLPDVAGRPTVAERVEAALTAC